ARRPARGRDRAHAGRRPRVHRGAARERAAPGRHGDERDRRQRERRREPERRRDRAEARPRDEGHALRADPEATLSSPRAGGYHPARLARIAAVSAVVCNYNGERYLEDCLRAVLAQEPDEVLVVDDASTDGSVALVRARFPAVEVLVLDRNRGPCAARNAGMRAARQRWVLAVDNDAVLEPDVLAKL